MESISLCSGSNEKNDFIFIRKHGVRVKKIIILLTSVCCCCCCCLVDVCVRARERTC
jgi:hypothetical protein